jgi:hypothetical protein
VETAGHRAIVAFAARRAASGSSNSRDFVRQSRGHRKRSYARSERHGLGCRVEEHTEVEVVAEPTVQKTQLTGECAEALEAATLHHLNC